MNPEDFQINEHYGAARIAAAFHDELQFKEYSYGKNLVGESFWMFKEEDEDKVVSFILIAANQKEYYYKCIYSDFQVPSC